MTVIPPPPHSSGEQPPQLPAQKIPQHIAIVMDGNGRWANERGLPRTAGHKAGEAPLLDVLAGAIEIGVKYVTVYAFSTENWRRSPEEVRFLMGFNKDVIRRRRDTMNSWGVRFRWSGRHGRLWRSVIKQLRDAEELTQLNTGCTLTMCVNYGGRAEIVDAVRDLAADAVSGRIKPDKISEKSIAARMYLPDLPDVDLFIRTSGEQRMSNFLLWQSAYAEMVFLDKYWPDIDRRDLWDAVKIYAGRDRRKGAAKDKVSDEFGKSGD